MLEKIVETIRTFPFEMKFPRNAPSADEAARLAVASFREHLAAMVTEEFAPVADGSIEDGGSEG